LVLWSGNATPPHDAILRYFGDEAETLDGCGKCDVCEALHGGELEADEVAMVVRKALSAVARVHRRFGLQAAVRLLRGERDPRLDRAGLDRTSTFGVLRDHPEAWLLRLLRRCVTAGWVDFTPGERPVALLTEAGRAVMKAERPARLLLPAPAGAAWHAPRPARRAPGGPSGLFDLSGPAVALFEDLRAHRLALSREQGVPPYVIASDRTLRELAAARPRTPGDLAAIHGIGPAKLQRYGRGLLDVIARAQG
jgi:ATP-dependent DNA helicase RecQ